MATGLDQESSPSPSRARDSGTETQSDAGDSRRRLEPLPRGLRYALFVLGAALVVLGLVGLALPVVPQVLPLLLGAAILSLASDAVYRSLQRALRPWPKVSERFREVRGKIHRLFSRSPKG